MLSTSPYRAPFGLVKKLFKLSLLLLVSLLGIYPCAAQQQASQNIVEVYLNQSRRISFEHASRVLVFNEDICSTKLSSEGVEFIGLKRGQSVVFAWNNDDVRTTYLVRVVLPPEVMVAPKLQDLRDVSLGHGYVASTAQSLTASDGPAVTAVVNRLDWEQGNENGRFSVRAQGEHTDQSSLPQFNVSSATIQYQNTHLLVSLVDSVLNVNGGPAAQITPYSTTSSLTLRGGDLIFSRGTSSFEVFGGTTIPPYFLRIAGTKDVAGINFFHKFSNKLSLFTTTAFTDIPVNQLFSTPTLRRQDYLQTLGLVSHLSSRWALEADGGVSTSGGHGQAEMSYARPGTLLYLSANSSAANFPLNQLQLFPSGTFLGSAGITQTLANRLVTSVSYQHVNSQPDIFFNTKSTADYVNPNLSILLSPNYRVSLGYTFSRTESNLVSSRTTNQREQVAFSSQFTSRLGNSIQASYGALGDPLQLNSQSQLSLRDTLDFRIKGHTFDLNVSHDRIDPSLASRINQQIQLLSPALQNLFLFDPAGFLAAGNLSPQLRTLLQGLQPSNTQVSLSGQFLIARRINFSPTIGYFHQDQGLSVKSSSQTFGYTLNWQLTQSLALQSSLSNVFLWDSSLGALRRNTILSVGFYKSFSGAPALNFHHSSEPRMIEGLVFRDANVNGSLNPGEAGIPNVLIHLDDGRSTVTDRDGRFVFTDLGRHSYKVSLELAQFHQPVRVTTPVTVSAIPGNGAQIQFGIVDFSRVTGTIFNDYLLNSKLQPDASGIKELALTLKGQGQLWRAKTDSSGQFEVDNVPAGSYELNVDRSTLPPDYVIPHNTFPVQVGPTSTFVQDIPVHALRSISGHVVFRAKAEAEQPAKKNARQSAAKLQPAEIAPRPLEGIKLTVGGATTTTDANGNFIFRELPGGPLLLTIIPDTTVADAVKLPSWPITLPHDAFRAEGVNITISNPELLAYILPRSAGAPDLSRPPVTLKSTSAAPQNQIKPVLKNDRLSAEQTKPEQAAQLNSKPQGMTPAEIPGKAPTAKTPGADSQSSSTTPAAGDNDHLIDCVQTIKKTRNGRRVLVCSDNLSLHE